MIRVLLKNGQKSKIFWGILAGYIAGRQIGWVKNHSRLQLFLQLLRVKMKLSH